MDATPPDTQRLLMAANLHRMRGELNEAETMIRAALQRDPDDYLTREFLGDVLTQKGDYTGAEAVYREVLKASPGRAAAEEKLARLILKATPVSSPTATGGMLRTDRPPSMVLLLSLVFPGAGHYYLGDRVKGLIFVAGAMLLTFAAVPAIVSVARPIAGAVAGGMGGGLEDGGMGGSGIGGGLQLFFLSLLIAALYFYAAFDAYALAKRVYRPG